MAAATVRPLETGSWRGVDSTGPLDVYPVDELKRWIAPSRTSFESRREQPIPTEVIRSFSSSLPLPIPENAGTPQLADLEQGRIIGKLPSAIGNGSSLTRPTVFGGVNYRLSSSCLSFDNRRAAS